MSCDPSRVSCQGEGLKFGYFKRPLHSTIDTRHAGPGELTVYCDGPELKAYCELTDHHDGTFDLTVRTQEAGIHSLNILYDGVHVPGSPYRLRVSPASLVSIQGPGISHGIYNVHSEYDFHLNTARAGPGSVKIRVGGPTGAFKVETRKESVHLLRCRYNPKISGLYLVHVYWSGDHVPGSPFRVFLARNQSELSQYLANASTA